MRIARGSRRTEHPRRSAACVRRCERGAKRGLGSVAEVFAEASENRRHVDDGGVEVDALAVATGDAVEKRPADAERLHDAERDQLAGQHVGNESREPHRYRINRTHRLANYVQLQTCKSSRNSFS